MDDLRQVRRWKNPVASTDSTPAVGQSSKEGATLEGAIKKRVRIVLNESGRGQPAALVRRSVANLVANASVSPKTAWSSEAMRRRRGVEIEVVIGSRDYDELRPTCSRS